MGTETCREFARNGANVALLDLDGKRVETAAEALAQAFGREMIKAGKGRLVHISTVASHSPETFSGAYSPTKVGVNMLSKMLACEWGPTAYAPTASTRAS